MRTKSVLVDMINDFFMCKWINKCKDVFYNKQNATHFIISISNVSIIHFEGVRYFMAVRRHIELAKRRIKAARFEFSSELAYLLGLILLALGTAMMERANFGMSMVVAPAYLVHLKVSQTLPFFTFGMAEYILQFVLLIALTAVMRRFRFSYLLSFVTALIYGVLLDGSMALVALIPAGGVAVRIVFYLVVSNKVTFNFNAVNCNIYFIFGISSFIDNLYLIIAN
jgi:hypothetical protein